MDSIVNRILIVCCKPTGGRDRERKREREKKEQISNIEKLRKSFPLSYDNTIRKYLMKGHFNFKWTFQFINLILLSLALIPETKLDGLKYTYYFSAIEKQKWKINYEFSNWKCNTVEDGKKIILLLWGVLGEGRINPETVQLFIHR